MAFVLCVQQSTHAVSLKRIAMSAGACLACYGAYKYISGVCWALGKAKWALKKNEQALVEQNVLPKDGLTIILD